MSFTIGTKSLLFYMGTMLTSLNGIVCKGGAIRTQSFCLSIIQALMIFSAIKMNHLCNDILFFFAFLFDKSLHLFFLVSRYLSFHPEHKITNMTNPDHSQNYTRNPDSFSCHHKKSEAHYKCNRNQNRKLSF